MNITIQYWGKKEEGKTYGSGENSSKYSLSVINSWSDKIKIEFNFKEETVGKSKNYDSQSYLKKGSIELPKRHAVELASAILTVCQSLEHTKNPQSVKLDINEYDLLHNIEEGITPYQLAKLLNVNEEIVIEEVEKQVPNNWSFKKLTHKFTSEFKNSKETIKDKPDSFIQKIVEETRLETLRNFFLTLKIVRNIQSKIKKS